MAEIAVAQQYGISYLPLMLMEERSSSKNTRKPRASTSKWAGRNSPAAM